jgi:hypothetical protein
VYGGTEYVFVGEKNLFLSVGRQGVGFYGGEEPISECREAGSRFLWGREAYF